MKKWYATLLLLMLCYTNALQAAFGISLGFNNPAYTDKGVNFLFSQNNWAIEVGIGDATVDTVNDEAFANVVGDLDVKYYFGQQLCLAVELGVRANYNGEGSADPSLSLYFSDPFVGIGPMYRTDRIYVYATGNYNLIYGDIYTAWGVGVFF